MIFVTSLAIVVVGLRWLARNPRTRAPTPPPPSGDPRIVPPPLPDAATRASWAPAGYQLPGDPDALLEAALQVDRQARRGAEVRDRPALERALTMMQRAAFAGHPEALRRVGTMLRGAGRTEREARAAVDWFRLAAGRGDAEAHFELGQCHLTGEGVLENRRDAIRWYRSACDLGSKRARRMLSALAEDGPG